MSDVYVTLDKSRGGMWLVIGTIFLLAIFFSICYCAWKIGQSNAKHLEEVYNPPLPIVPQELFKKDGCTMYKFLDGATYHYYSDCANIKIVE